MPEPASTFLDFAQRDYKQKVASISQGLRDLADKVDREVLRDRPGVDSTPRHASHATQVLHELTWSMAGLGASDLVRRAAQADQAEAKALSDLQEKLRDLSTPEQVFDQVLIAEGMNTMSLLFENDGRVTEVRLSDSEEQTGINYFGRDITPVMREAAEGYGAQHWEEPTQVFSDDRRVLTYRMEP